MTNKKQIKEFIDEVSDISETSNRSHLSIQQFMSDMQILGDQLKDGKLVKPIFNFGDLGVTNYLLWLLLGEAMKLNDKLDEEEI